jgi:hypothetical protein
MSALKPIEDKIFNSRWKWDEVDRELAKKTPKVLELLHEACLIESYFSAYMGKMLELFSYDVKATSMFTIEAFEAYTHYFVLRKYLDIVGYNPVTDEEIVALRRKDEGVEHRNEIRELVNFGMTEFFADYFFDDLASMAVEPILVDILKKFSHEEKVHAEFAFELLSDRMITPDVTQQILEHVKTFEHVGSYVLPTVSKAKDDNLAIIKKFNERIEELVQMRPSEYFSK